MSRYVVGIDLGTTNSALAYAEGNVKDDDETGPISYLPIPQVVAVNDVSPVGAVVSRLVSSQTSFVQVVRVVDVITMLCHVVPSVE